jgi:hypothetical protein
MRPLPTSGLIYFLAFFKRSAIAAPQDATCSVTSLTFCKNSVG